ncbi:MAG: hypothetical protein MZV64_09920 [Ignavibacteriales bacterium]|nr:hypothetical protein [Ignavibacteriales bacterium]
MTRSQEPRQPRGFGPAFLVADDTDRGPLCGSGALCGRGGSSGSRGRCRLRGISSVHGHGVAGQVPLRSLMVRGRSSLVVLAVELGKDGMAPAGSFGYVSLGPPGLPGQPLPGGC